MIRALAALRIGPFVRAHGQGGHWRMKHAATSQQVAARLRWDCMPRQRIFNAVTVAALLRMGLAVRVLDEVRIA